MNLAIFNTYCTLLVIAVLSVSCNKNVEADKLDTGMEAISAPPVPVPPYTWTNMATPGNGTTYPSNSPYRAIFTAPVGDTYYCWAGDGLERVYKLNKASLRWESQYTMNDNHGYLFSENRILFSWQSKIYFGFDNFIEPRFGVFDPVTRTTTNLAPFPGSEDSVGTPETFVVGDNGYLFFGGGFGQYWRYNFPTNTWTLLGESPLGKRYEATIVVVGEKVYAGLGWEIGSFAGQTFRQYKRDWVQFQVDAPGSVTKASFTGVARGYTKTCVIGDNIYVGFGHSINTQQDNPTTTRYYDLWKYDISANTWGRCSDWPGTTITVKDGANLHTQVSMFSMGKSVYVVSGGINEFWRYANTLLVTPQ